MWRNYNPSNTYLVFHPRTGLGFEMNFWKIPPAGGQLLQLATAQAGPRNAQRKINTIQARACERMKNGVDTFRGKIRAMSDARAHSGE